MVNSARRLNNNQVSTLSSVLCVVMVLTFLLPSSYPFRIIQTLHHLCPLRPLRHSTSLSQYESQWCGVSLNQATFVAELQRLKWVVSAFLLVERSKQSLLLVLGRSGQQALFLERHRATQQVLCLLH